MKRLRYDSPAFAEWRRDTRNAVAYTFGESSSHVKEIEGIKYPPTIMISRNPNAKQDLLDKATAILNSMVTEVREYWEDDPQKPSSIESTERLQSVGTNRVFVVHGRDHGTRDSVARLLEKLGLETVILQEQPDEGLTIIEKFEKNAQGDFVVALFTPDDIGGLSNGELQSRARQNVIFELGYFVGKFGRNSVRALVKGNVEIPSDYLGVLLIALDEHEDWQMKLIREMKSAGLDIDANRAL